MADFKENEHPRDEQGKFTAKEGRSKRKQITELLKKKCVYSFLLIKNMKQQMK